ncbi:acyl-CoA dehydrogenase family protein [Streptomyces sp. B6B3]|uniref:acyl-CoA dehydrogenase family protein n=1 Tax=Streptomyces sp. B6B3 TaxID=3153570 RepID=UPI00325DBF0C
MTESSRAGRGGGDTPLLAAAREIAASAAARAVDTDGERRPSDDAIKAMRDAGFMRQFVPERFGGRAGTFRELLPAVTAIGERCPATAWLASLFASTPRWMPFFPEAGLNEVWAAGPDAAVAGSVIPFGEAVVDGDGLRVSGRWPYMSGIEFSDWVIVCPRVAGGEGPPRLSLVLFERSACEIEDTWHTVGMRATGSHSVVLNDVFVPAERIVDRATVFAGRGSLAPLPAANGLTFVVPALGAARGALDLLTDFLARRTRGVSATPGLPGPGGNLATYDMVLARSAAEIDSVALLLDRVAEVVDGGEITPALIARNARDSAYALELLTTATNRIFRTAGTSGQVADGPLGRLWRDVNSMATHQALQFEPVARGYVRSLFESRD